ncbi:hypothetical protein DAETH_34590 (plasmid) [Deinococcus aetherius]|uniref:PIN domain-containing protein n=1 Tax=Deinococcus aetherius TaxID=200252 RepID=A0ABM8AI47_9DEIO|nr:PIN domain-containing protein [Deinococcus aetherius]BDP43490.1 hypothetical protein DAETH_34590 [Deinococcus aetherius]
MTRPVSVCLDSNVILSVRFREPGSEAVAGWLDSVPHLIVCGPVVAELMPRDPHAEEWLRDAGIEVDWTLGRSVWRRVGELHAGYTARRRSSGGGMPRRPLTDYLIGAHAEVSGFPLFTLNPADYAPLTELEVLTLRRT